MSKERSGGRRREEEEENRVGRKIEEGGERTNKAEGERKRRTE